MVSLGKLRWASLMVERRKGDRDFWCYNGMGDNLAALLEPLAVTGTDTRKEVRRLISVIADAGSLVAREALARLAGQRSLDCSALYRVLAILYDDSCNLFGLQSSRSASTRCTQGDRRPFCYRQKRISPSYIKVFW